MEGVRAFDFVDDSVFASSIGAVFGSNLEHSKSLTFDPYSHLEFSGVIVEEVADPIADAWPHPFTRVSQSHPTRATELKVPEPAHADQWSTFVPTGIGAARKPTPVSAGDRARAEDLYGAPLVRPVAAMQAPATGPCAQHSSSLIEGVRTPTSTISEFCPNLI